MFSFENLGQRMKEYEAATRLTLPRRSYTVIRVDGIAFHTLTKKFKKPFDDQFVQAMNDAAIELCSTVMGAQFAFVQSDEISVLVTDFSRVNTEAWYGNCVQKMCSASASAATAGFNRSRLLSVLPSDRDDVDDDLLENIRNMAPGKFDSRVYQIPQRIEVGNYFLWRQWDTVRNSISAVAHSLYSQSELHGKSGDEQQELIYQKGINWNDYDPALKRGRIVVRRADPVTNRSKWKVEAAPSFSQAAGKVFLEYYVKENAPEPTEEEAEE